MEVVKSQCDDCVRDCVWRAPTGGGDPPEMHCPNFKGRPKSPKMQGENTAKWEWNEHGVDYNIGSWVCGKCHNRPESMWQWEKANNPVRFSGSRYCPNCGAKMY